MAINININRCEEKKKKEEDPGGGGVVVLESGLFVLVHCCLHEDIDRCHLCLLEQIRLD